MSRICKTYRAASWGSLLLLLILTSGCYSTKMGDYVGTREISGSRTKFQEAATVRLKNPRSQRLDSVVIAVRTTPTYRVKGVKQYQEIREANSRLPFLFGLAALTGAGFIIDMECETTEAATHSSDPNASSLDCSTIGSVGIATLGIAGGLSIMFALNATEEKPERTGQRLSGETVWRIEQGRTRAASRVSVRVAHGRQVQRYRTDRYGRIVVDLADDFGVRSLDANETVTLRLSSNEMRLSEQVTVRGPRRMPRRPSTVIPFVSELPQGSSSGVTLRHLPRSKRARAQRYASIVREQAAKRRVPQALVWAVMQAESNFNPKARSPKSAIGLMQLVPSSGGREAYGFVYGRDASPSIWQLQDPETNIALGVGYLHLLLYRHFRTVQDPASRLYCAIAGYHTGPSNVARSFRTRRVDAAITRINRMSSQQVKRTLLRRLPYRSTRTYLGTVLRYMRAYHGK